MRIAISGMFWTEPHVGSGQYLHNLVAQFAARASGHQFILVLPRYRGAEQPSLRSFQTVLMPTPYDHRSENLAKVWFEQVALGQICRQMHADVLHVPYFGSPRFSKLPVITTVHDLIPLLVPGNRGGRAVQLYMRLAASSARRAHTVIADSHHTKMDVMQHLGISDERVVVTHLAASPELQPQSATAIAAVKERFQIVEPYVFYIGGFQAHKNVSTAIRAFARARRTLDHRVLLVIAGRLPTHESAIFPNIHRVILEENVAEDVVLLGSVSETEKAALLSGCEAFVFPSRYEGFGLPPLEAMQCGAPVLASATTSVGEIIGEGGVQLPPEDIDAWAAALGEILTDPNLREQLRIRGMERAKAFRWEQTAQQTLDVYEQVAQAAPISQ